MITAVIAPSGLAPATNTTDYRIRAVTTDRPLLPDSTTGVPKNARPGSQGEFGPAERETPAQPEQPKRDSTSMFAAAVIAGTLSPVPQTMEQLLQRIGISPIPEESQARLKDLLA